MNEHLNDLHTMRDELSPIDKRCPLPEELSGEAIARRLKAPRAPLFTLRRGLALAAAAVVLCSTAFVSGRLGLFSGKPNLLSPGNTEADTETLPEHFESYYALEKAFLQLQEERDVMVAEYGRASLWDMVGGVLGGVRKSNDLESAVQDSAPEAAEDGSYTGSTTAGKGSHGSTNTQVANVDEADILKNDGEYLYYVSGSAVYILSALPADEMQVLAKLSIPDYRNDTQLYVDGDRMALVYSEYPPGGDPAASIQVYNTANKSKPLLVKTFSQKGSVLSSRMQNGRIYLLSTQGANLDFSVRDGVIPPAEILPKVYNNGQEAMVSADCVTILPENTEPSYLVVSSLDLQSSSSQSETAAILGAGSDVYCNTEALFVACRSWKDSFGKTLIYRFDLLEDGKIKAGPQGEVEGTPLNQFSMDEYEGYFRIATSGWSKRGESVNILTVLDKNLKQTGILDNLAPGETIQSARFIGKKGYIVTFRQTDPLFVIDLSNPAKPKVDGELKLPGFSAYLHPWDATHLIGIGPDGDEQGTNGGTKISLFDISDPAAPKEIDRVQIPNSWTDIQHNHKIFTACKEEGLFGLPITRYDVRGYNNRGDVNCFYTFRVNGDDITQAHVLEAPKLQTARSAHSEQYDYAYYYNTGVQRATYIGSTWYVLGDNPASLTAYAMDSGDKLGELDLR